MPGVRLSGVGDCSSLDEGVRSSDERVRESSASGSGERSGCSPSEGSSDRSAVAARVADRAAGGGDHRGVYVGHHGCGRHPRAGFDRPEFATIGKGLWFALQTVTTVGYGDVTPKHADGRFIGAVVMLTGIGFLTVITASVTASLIESSRGRFAESVRELARQLQAVSERLVTIEALLAQPTPSELSDGVS